MDAQNRMHFGIPKLSQGSIERLIRLATLESERVSSVTTGWKVLWSQDECARDIFQNFYDANGSNVDVAISDDVIQIFGAAEMDLDHAFYFRSTKDPSRGDIGYFGEGLKAASLCLLRDYNARLLLVSRRRAVEIMIQNSDDASARPLVYRYYRLGDANHSGGTRLILEQTDNQLQQAFANAPRAFFSPDHPLLGAKIAGDFNTIYIARTQDDTPGAIFYRNLERAKLELPFVVAIFKPYKSLDNLTGRDRDRNAFGEKLKATCYRIVANSRVLAASDAFREFLALSREFWETGHPLLSTLLARRPPGSYADLFQDEYYAADTRVHRLDVATLVQVRDIESSWRSAGRKKLPQCFRNVGVPSAMDAHDEQQRKSREEAARELRQQQRSPTESERHCIDLLEEALRFLSPGLAPVVLRGAQYFIADTQALLGAWQRSRTYGTREIYLAARLFVEPFRKAFATHLHECSHLFGWDGSRGFTDALTQLIEEIAHRPDKLQEYTLRWNDLAAVVRSERSAEPSEDRAYDYLCGLTLQQASQAISQYLSAREQVLATLVCQIGNPTQSNSQNGHQQ